MNRMPLFATWADMSEKKAVIVGGGENAGAVLRKIMFSFGSVTVLAPEISETLREILEKRDSSAGGKHGFARLHSAEISWIKEPYSRERIMDADVVFACMGYAKEDQDISASCRCLGIPVSLPDMPDQSRFFLEPYPDAVPIEENLKLIHAIMNLNSYAWIVWTDPAAVYVFFEQMKSSEKDIRCLGHMKTAAAGADTAAELERHGIFADRMLRPALQDVGNAEAADERTLMLSDAEPDSRVLVIGTRYGVRVPDGAVADVVAVLQ